MSNNLFDQYVNLINKASRSSNESEKRMFLDQANKICAMPEFTTSETPSRRSNNNNSRLTNVDSGPGNSITSNGNTFGFLGYNLPNF
jgi:hypothetical protein